MKVTPRKWGIATGLVLVPLLGAFALWQFHADSGGSWWRSVFTASANMVFYVAAVVFLTARPGDERARVASVLSITLALTWLVPRPERLIEQLTTAPVSFATWVLAFGYAGLFGLTVALLVHLVLIFPRRAPTYSNRLLVELYVVPLALGAGVPLISFHEELALYIPFITWLLLVFACLVAAPLIMWRQYRRSTFEERRQILWPALGITAAIVLGVIVPSISSWKFSRHEIFIGVAATALPFTLIPLTFLMAMFKYRLFAIDVIIRKTVTYTIVTIFLFALYGGVVASASYLLAGTGVSDETARLAATAVVAALFVPARDRAQRRIDARFYRRKYDDIESVRILDGAIDSATDVHSLLSEAASRLQQIFVCQTAAVLVRKPRSSSLTISSAVGLHDAAIHNVHLTCDSSATRSILNLDRHPDESADEEAVRAMRARLLIPVRSHGDLSAVIALGAKLSDEGYDARDERVAAALADRLAGALENFRFRELTAAESEWRSLDRISRLVFLAVAHNSEAVPADQIVARVGTALDAAGMHATDERVKAAVARLVDRGAILRVDPDALEVGRPAWLVLPDLLRPIEQVARDAGQRVGAYELLDRIGRGGMGEVYRATNVHDGSFAAVKILPPLDSRAEARKRFEREGALVAALSHPNIVRVLERGEHDGRLYIAMELLDGDTLARAIQEPSWNTSCSLDVALQIASALADLHSLGVVHRDVKSSNVMLTCSGRAVLLDFGLARSEETSSLTAESQILGSLPYMAPERFSEASFDVRADVWAFGVVLYELLTRRSPWASTGPSALIAEICRGEVDWTPLETIPGVSSLTGIVRESLQVEPALRIRDGSELLRRLTLAAESSPPKRQLPIRPAIMANVVTLTYPAPNRDH